MPKTYSQYICQQCGYQSPSYLGKCPECGEWNSLVETEVAQDSGTKGQSDRVLEYESKLFKLSDVKSLKVERIPSGFSEFDRVLGGGIVPGSIVLISGDPGIGKSTLLLQAAVRIAEGTKGQRDKVYKVYKGAKKPLSPLSTSSLGHSVPSSAVLYVSGEESAQQVKIRAERLGKIPNNLYILPETDVDTVLAATSKLNPSLLIIDSIQTLSSQKLTGSAGSVGQLRECSQTLQRFAKATHIPIIIVGHVTKEGAIAGPKVLEHLVDAVLNLEGDDMYTFRLLRSVKNRFGSTFEVGVFEMRDTGMTEITNPSGVFLEHTIASRAGSVVTSTLAGGRPILAEVQALATVTIFPVPTRRVTGLDFSRVQIVIAALSKVAKISLANLDIYVNVAGGLKISEPASDLAVALAIVSAVRDVPIKAKTCAFGEVGLLGELRPIGNIKARIAEAKRLGFENFITSEKYKTLDEAIRQALT